jgi:uncharacterized protein (TIGR02246 family)
MATLEQGVTKLFDAFVDAYQERSPDRALALFTEDAVIVGTGADEVRFGIDEIRDQIERDLSQADALRLSYSGLRVTGSGDIAWCYADLTANVKVGEANVTMKMRFTATVRRDNDEVRFVQGHLSIPAAEQAEGESYTAPS